LDGRTGDPADGLSGIFKLFGRMTGMTTCSRDNLIGQQ
jgi:hypothetical protein